MTLRKTGFILLALLLAAMAIVPCLSATDETTAEQNVIGVTVPAPKTMDIHRLISQHAPQQEERFIITDPMMYLTFWNEKMHWGFSDKEIESCVKKWETSSLNEYRYESGTSYEITDVNEFGKDLQTILDITNAQVADFVSAQNQQIRIDQKNFAEPSKSLLSSMQISDTVLMAGPTTQSAPSAVGNLYTAIIFTDFQIPGEEGVWRESHKDDAYYDAWIGTNQIKSQADPRAGVENSLGYYTVTVSGQNTGDNSASWGISGWMERAAQNLGYSDSNSDGRITDDMARSLKTYAGADSVSLMFLTHDAYSGYAVGPDQGYADKAAIGYWWVGSGGVHYFSQPFDYEHEALHLYGALDEYIPMSYCGQASILAVDPMQQFYTNTNHVTCAGATTSVMRERGQTLISSSTKKFIGWGDHDNDGTLDPFDSTP